jgi:hypothetical protein
MWLDLHAVAYLRTLPRQIHQHFPHLCVVKGEFLIKLVDSFLMY